MNTRSMRAGTAAQDSQETDCQLLARFVKHDDSDAFAELVSRYASLVLGVCRRTLRDEHSAEDAFQATFLVLARRAARIHRRSSLAPWLYAVAHRTALRAEAKRRRRREQTLLDEMTDTHNVLTQVSKRYEQQLLDEEMQQLAAKYREPLVLRYLMGKSNKQVAAELGLAVGVVEGRIKQGKLRLRQRLSRRGISATIALATVGASAVTARASETLVAATVQAAVALHTSAALPNDISQNAIQLSQQELVMKTTTLVTTTSMAAVAIVMAGFALAQEGETGKRPTAATPATLTVSPADFAAEQSAVRLALDKKSDTKKQSIDSASTAEDQIIKTLREPTNLALNDAPLREAMDMLAEMHKLRILIDHRALDDVGLSGETTVTLELSGVSLESALNHMLHQLDLTWTIQNEVLMITTPEEVENNLLTKVYDVGDLVLCEDKEGIQWADYDTLIELITSTIAPDTWDEVGGAGAIEAAPFAGAQMLTIAQTCQVHSRVEKLLKSIREITEEKHAGLTIREKPDQSGMIGGMRMGGTGMGTLGRTGLRSAANKSVPQRKSANGPGAPSSESASTGSGTSSTATGGGVESAKPAVIHKLIKVVVYDVSKIEGQPATEPMKSLLLKSLSLFVPNARVSLNEKTNQLVIAASDADHERIRKLLNPAD